MNVTISVSGSFFPAYHYGRYLEEQGRLTRLINPLPYSRTQRFGVSRERTRSLWGVGGLHYVNHTYVPTRLKPWAQLALHVSFDKAAALQLGEPDIVNVWAANGLTTIRRAHRMGLNVVLHTGSTHIESQTEVLREEFERFKYAGALTLPTLVERTVQEYAEADAIVVPSRVSRESFVERGLPPEKLYLVPWAGRPVTGPPPERERRSRPRVLFVGNCSLRKGIPYLLAAFRELAGRATLRLVGPVDASVIEAAGGLPSGAEIVGPLRGEALAEEYRSADIFALASVEEGSAFVVMEAMAAGLPVVVTDRVGADQVEDESNGFIVRSRDSVALAERIGELVDDWELRQRFGVAAVASVVERDWRMYGRDLDECVFAPIYERGTHV